MYRKRRERNRNKRGRAGGSECREPGKLGRFVSEEEESDSFIEAYLAEVENAESEDEEDAEDMEAEDVKDTEAEDAEEQKEAEDAEFLIERSDEVELWPWEENEEDAREDKAREDKDREDKAPARNSYQNRTCRRTCYREEVGRQRNAGMKGKWKGKKR